MVSLSSSGSLVAFAFVFPVMCNMGISLRSFLEVYLLEHGPLISVFPWVFDSWTCSQDLPGFIKHSSDFSMLALYVCPKDSSADGSLLSGGVVILCVYLPCSSFRDSNFLSNLKCLKCWQLHFQFIKNWLSTYIQGHHYIQTRSLLCCFQWSLWSLAKLPSIKTHVARNWERPSTNGFWKTGSYSNLGPYCKM